MMKAKTYRLKRFVVGILLVILTLGFCVVGTGAARPDQANGPMGQHDFGGRGPGRDGGFRPMDGEDGFNPPEKPEGDEDRTPPERPEGEDGFNPPEKPEGDEDRTPPEKPEGDEDRTPPERPEGEGRRGSFEGQPLEGIDLDNEEQVQNLFQRFLAWLQGSGI